MVTLEYIQLDILFAIILYVHWDEVIKCWHYTVNYFSNYFLDFTINSNLYGVNCNFTGTSSFFIYSCITLLDVQMCQHQDCDLIHFIIISRKECQNRSIFCHKRFARFGYFTPCEILDFCEFPFAQQNIFLYLNKII